MRVVRCPNGHYYDADRFGSNCPQCGTAANVSSLNSESTPTVPLETQSNDVGATPANTSATVPGGNATQKTAPDSGDVTKPVSIDMMDGMATAPVVGWLVCTKGVNKGKDYRLHQGRNFIGRAPQMDVFIQGDVTVSRSTHAIVVYDPRSNIYLAQPGDAKELLYINDTVVLNTVELKKMDKLNIGETTLLFVPLCDEDFHW